MDNINQKIEEGKSNGIQERFLEFSLGSEEYAIPLLLVREVIPVPETTPIPKSPPHFLGIMNLRGTIISIVDMRKKLMVDPKENREEAVIIINVDDVNVGMIVDAINRVLVFSEDEVKHVPKIESKINSNFIQGIYQKGEQLTSLLDICKILDLKEYSKHSAA
jgi:purine-binding chemotaxis protein CheW